MGDGIVALDLSDADRRVHVPLSTDGTWADAQDGGTVEVAGWFLRRHLPSDRGVVYPQQAMRPAGRNFRVRLTAQLIDW